jgi:hypothetical protein
MPTIEITELTVFSFSVLSAAGSYLWSAHYNRKTKILELSINTANSEFSDFCSRIAGTTRKPRPMSAYVLFHYTLFKKMDRTGRRYPISQALQETLDEVEPLFSIYATSRLQDYQVDYDTSLPHAAGDPLSPSPASPQA